jgi:hypothetical protein
MTKLARLSPRKGSVQTEGGKQKPGQNDRASTTLLALAGQNLTLHANHSLPGHPLVYHGHYSQEYLEKVSLRALSATSSVTEP